jgi:hypothetical protein
MPQMNIHWDSFAGWGLGGPCSRRVCGDRLLHFGFKVQALVRLAVLTGSLVISCLSLSLTDVRRPTAYLLSDVYRLLCLSAFLAAGMLPPVCCQLLEFSEAILEWSSQEV